MKASFAQLSITECRNKILKAIKRGETVKIQATIIIKNDCLDNLEHDEDYVFDFITGDVKDVRQL